VGNQGIVEVASPDKAAMEKAVNWIKAIVEVPEPGKTYHGTVKSIQTFGAFVEFLPGKEGLLHISEISYDRLKDMEGVMQPGDQFDVKLLEVDQKTGKFRLSKRALMPKPEGYVEREERPRGDRDRGGRDDRRGGYDRGGRDRRDDRGGRGGDRRDDRRGGYNDRGGDRDRGGYRNERDSNREHTGDHNRHNDNNNEGNESRYENHDRSDNQNSAAE
jgi:polyribonucleotide nucleotidyltransferase